MILFILSSDPKYVRSTRQQGCELISYMVAFYLNWLDLQFTCRGLFVNVKSVTNLSHNFLKVTMTFFFFKINKHTRERKMSFNIKAHHNSTKKPWSYHNFWVEFMIYLCVRILFPCVCVFLFFILFYFIKVCHHCTHCHSLILTFVFLYRVGG